MANEKIKIGGVVTEVVPHVGTPGHVLRKTTGGVKWSAENVYQPPDHYDASMINESPNKRFVSDSEKETWNAKIGIPAGGFAGQVLKRTSSGYGWGTDDAGPMTPADKTKLDGIETGAQKNSVTSVAGKTGAVKLTKRDVGLGNVANYFSYANVFLTEAEYKALSVKDPNTIYIRPKE